MTSRASTSAVYFFWRQRNEGCQCGYVSKKNTNTRTELSARQTKRTTGSSNNTEYFLSGEATTLKFIAHHPWKRPCRKRARHWRAHPCGCQRQKTPYQILFLSGGANSLKIRRDWSQHHRFTDTCSAIHWDMIVPLATRHWRTKLCGDRRYTS